jgi:hypothetical protein
MTRRALAALVLAAFALAPRAQARESKDACLAAYNADYAANWRLVRAAWDAKCAEGMESGEIIRSHQAAFVGSCVEKFLPGAQKAGFNGSDLHAYCARGTSAEEMLSARTGIAVEAAGPGTSAGQGRAMDGPAVGDNAWTRIYAVTREKGDLIRKGPLHGADEWWSQTTDIYVYLPRHPGVEALAANASEVCEVHVFQCSRCKDLPGYSAAKLDLAFKDKGCRGTLESIEWLPTEPSLQKRRDYTRAWLDAKTFELLGEREEEELRWWFRSRHGHS